MRVFRFALLSGLLFSLSAAPSYGAERTAVEVGDVAPSKSTPIVFVDALKQSCAWQSSLPLSVDVDGNVLSLARGQSAQRLVFAAGQARAAGDYTLLYDGSGAFAVFA